MKYRTKSIDVDATQLQGGVLVETTGGYAKGNSGDYLVTDPDGTHRVVPAADFERDYEPVETPPAATGPAV